MDLFGKGYVHIIHMRLQLPLSCSKRVKTEIKKSAPSWYVLKKIYYSPEYSVHTVIIYIYIMITNYNWTRCSVYTDTERNRGVPIAKNCRVFNCCRPRLISWKNLTNSSSYRSPFGLEWNKRSSEPISRRSVIAYVILNYYY